MVWSPGFQVPFPNPEGSEVGDPSEYALVSPSTTGAVAATRYVGGTASGAPTTGTFAVGDFVIDQTGIVWVNTVAGTPGTWVDASSSGRELDYASNTISQTSASTAFVNITGLEIDFTVASRPVYVIAESPWTTGTAASAVGYSIRDGSNVDIRLGGAPIAGTTSVGSITMSERITTPGNYTRRFAFARSAGTGTLTHLAGLATLVATLRAVEA
jgi:hypothetical protein